MTAFIEDVSVQEVDDAVSKNLALIVCFSIFVVILAVVIWLLVTQNISNQAIDQVLLHDRSGKSYKVAPEPVERTIFVMLAILVPVVMSGYFWYGGFGGVIKRKAISFSPSLDLAMPFFVAALLTIPFLYSGFSEVFFFPAPWVNGYKLELVFAAILVSLVIILYNNPYTKRTSRSPAVLWWVSVASAVALQVLPYRIASINSVTLAPTWSGHLDAVIYPLNQVVHGKTIIVDLPSQYGFYPELIAPIFKMFGVSVFSVTIFFAFLHVVGLIAVAALLKKYVKSSILSMMIFLTMLISMSLFMYLNGNIEDIYVQYFPIRFFWPVVALLLFASHASSPSRLKLCVLGVITGLSIFWNIDTGIPVMISIGATLLVKSMIARRSVLKGITVSATFCVLAVFTVAACFAGLRIKAGVPLNFGEVLAYQKIFYMTGFAMIPMPLTPDPWQVVLAIYIAGAITALSGWRQCQENSVFDVLFCSAILGLGLFAYYQGRSHVYCLILVAWPAIFIGGILADKILDAAWNRTTKASTIALAIPLVFFFSLGTITFLYSSSALFADAERNLSTLSIAKDPTVADELGFMQNTYDGRNCLILSQRQAIYSAELGIASPIKGPGIVETLLQSDLDKLVDRALTEPVDCIYLGVKEGTITYIDVGDASLMARFPVISKNPLGTMMLLEPAPPPAP